MKKDISIYTHWPFCLSKCPYCDFNSHVSDNIDNEQWERAFLTELDNYADYLKDRKIQSIFFGGGTPSLMPSKLACAYLNKLDKISTIESDVEITLEANPNSIEVSKFKEFADAGINRVSIGIQSFNEKDLNFLGRNHSVDEAKKAIEIADGCFPNYSFDLIYALPEQSPSAWEKELKSALRYAKYHLSLYQLTIEKGTPFFSLHRRGQIQIPDEEKARELYTLTENIMEDAGMPAYEISNYARKGYESKHNLAYWKYKEYLGIGPGAHGRYDIGGIRHATVSHHLPQKWLYNVLNKGNGAKVVEPLSAEEIAYERMLMKLRSNRGIPLYEVRNESKAFDLVSQRLAKIEDGVMSLTLSGRLVLNSIADYLTE